MTAAPTRLRAEFLDSPIGLALETPRLSWCCGDSRAAELQTAWQIQAASSAALLTNVPDLWDSGVVEGGDHIGIVYAGSGVVSRACVYWRVRTFDSDGLASDWSAMATFEFSLSAEQWVARWIAVPLHGTRMAGPPVPLLRRRFRSAAGELPARLHLAVLGACRVWINETELDVSEVPSGLTDYTRRIRFQTLCVDGLVRQGANSLTVLLADGWYAGFADGVSREHFGTRPRLLAQLEIGTGSPVIVATDDQWEWRFSPLVRADISTGASIDGRAFGHHEEYIKQKRQWSSVDVLPAVSASLRPCALPGVRPLPDDVGQPSLRGAVRRRGGLRPGERRWWVSFDVPVLGRPKIMVRGAHGSHLRIRYASTVDADGQPCFVDGVFDDYTLNGDAGNEIFLPPFVRHRFQLIELTGDLAADGVIQVDAIPVRQLLADQLVLHVEHPLLERFHDAVVARNLDLLQEVPWAGFAANQRLGDYGALYPVLDSLAMQFDLCAWLRHWLDDMLAAECTPAGLPDTVPALKHARRLVPGIGSVEHAFVSTQGDPQRQSEMAIHLAEVLYVHYGDRQALERVFPFARRLLFTLEALNPNLIRPLDSDAWQLAPMEAALVGTALYHEAALRAARIASWLGLEGEAQSLLELGQRIRVSFRQRFVTRSGLLLTDSPNAYVLALAQSLVEGDEAGIACNRLTQMILDAGFQSVVHPALVDKMLRVLTENARPDLAYALMLQTASPAWLAPLTEGASLEQADVSLTQGAPLGWIYQHVAGLQPLTDELPAFSRVVIQPCVPMGGLFPEGSPLNTLQLEFDSMQGRYGIRWSLADGLFHLQVDIPCGCRAVVILPDGSRHEAVAGRHDYRLVADKSDVIPMLSETY